MHSYENPLCLQLETLAEGTPELDRTEWRCERCQKPGRLEVHHKTSLWVDISQAFDQENLEVLCRDCHISHHRLEKLAKSEGKPKNAPVQEPWLDFANELA